MGRPSSYTPELAEQICAAMCTGKLLPQVCKLKGMPGVSTVYLWLSQNPAFVEQYARAKEIQCDVIAAGGFDIADESRIGKKTKTTVCNTCRGKGVISQGDDQPAAQCARCDGAGVFTEVTTADMVERSRLMVDVRKWYLSKVLPKKYGDRLELAGDPDAPIKVSVADVLRQRRAKRAAESIQPADSEKE